MVLMHSELLLLRLRALLLLHYKWDFFGFKNGNGTTLLQHFNPVIIHDSFNHFGGISWIIKSNSTFSAVFDSC